MKSSATTSTLVTGLVIILPSGVKQYTSMPTPTCLIGVKPITVNTKVSSRKPSGYE